MCINIFHRCLSVYRAPKSNSSPLKSYRKPNRKPDRLPVPNNFSKGASCETLAAYFVEYWLPILRCGFHETRALFCSSKYPYHPCMVYLPLVDFYGKYKQIYQPHGSYGIQVVFCKPCFGPLDLSR